MASFRLFSPCSSWLRKGAVFGLLCLSIGFIRAEPPIKAPTTTPTPYPRPTPPKTTSTSRPKPTKDAPSANVTKLQAWKDAELIASLAPGRTEVVGAGDSMKPVYGENTILVISKIPFEELKAGMSVAYTNQRGRQVVHQLISRDSVGWRVQGINNAVEDKDRVTRGNLIGVIYASISYGETP